MILPYQRGRQEKEDFMAGLGYIRPWLKEKGISSVMLFKLGQIHI